MIIKCNWIVPNRMNAITIGTIIFANDKSIKDKSIILHEQKHVEQFKSNPFTFWIKYIFNKKCRCQFEAEAYATQIKDLCDNGSIRLHEFIDYYTNILYVNYGLNLSKEYVKTLIIKECCKLGLQV